MKVIHVNTYTTGGAAKACSRLSQGLNLHSQISSRVLHRKLSQTKSTLGYKIKNSERLTIAYFLTIERLKKRLRRDIETFENPITPYKINKQEIYHESDIINLHWTSNFLDYSSFFQECKKPIVWTLHDMQPFTGGYPYEFNFPFHKYSNYIQKNLNLKSKAVQETNLNIVCLSKWMVQQSQKSDILSRFPHHIIPNGLNTSVFKPYPKENTLQKYSLPSNKKILLFVSDKIENKRKGIEHLIKAIQNIAIPNAITCAVGSLNKEIKSIQNLYCLGHINDEMEMAKLYSLADILVIPSLDDNLPNTALESICCGTPIIGYKVGGMTDIVQNGFNGFLATKGDINNLSYLIKNSLETEWSNSNIRSAAKRKYDITVQVSKYNELYDSIINN